MIKIISLLSIIICFCLAIIAQPNVLYDVVMVGGRVIDLETKLDAIKNVRHPQPPYCANFLELLKGK